MSLKENIENTIERLKEVEAHAREKLANKNLADQISSAIGRLSMASEHPDLELLEKEDHDDGQKPLPFDPGASANQPQHSE